MSEWTKTMEFRWYRQKGGTDNDKRLQQMWMRNDGTSDSDFEWHDVPTFLED